MTLGPQLPLMPVYADHFSRWCPGFGWAWICSGLLHSERWDSELWVLQPVRWADLPGLHADENAQDT